MPYEAHVVSVCGPVRDENQDAGAVWRGEDEALAVIVADGMGGHAAGREAAESVVRACVARIRNRGSTPWPALFSAAVEDARSGILAAAGDDSDRRSMGSTLALAVLESAGSAVRLHMAHVGDSRVYLYRGRSLFRLTTDHSLVAQMVREGLLREDEAFGHPDGNVIRRAIGQAPVEPEIQSALALDPGDLVLVCSDGLHGALREEAIREVLERSRSAEAACRNLLDAALAAGSQDNVTIGCARVLVGDGATRRPTRAED